MPITIDGNGTITGASTLTTTVANPTFTTPNINSAQFATVSGTAPIYPCRAWVNFNGTGTVAIRASGNVSSVTDIGLGDYGVNFTTAMPDTNYAFVGTASDVSWGSVVTDVGKTTSQQRFFVYANAGTAVGDASVVNVAIFR